MIPPYPNFHGEDVVASAPAEALFHLIAAPFEHSVSYGAGTAAGPEAILAASAQLELFTGKGIPAEHGIYTAPPVDCSGGVEKTLANIEQAVGAALAHNAIPVVLGGEHTVSCGVVAALKTRYKEFGVIQFDAHADLRDSYGGSPWSHACVMRRIHEQGIPIYQLATRSYSLAEHHYRQTHAIAYRDGEEIWQNGCNLTLPADFPEKVFITFDLDGLDSAVMPATGTPVPGGLSWYQAMAFIEAIMASRTCIGFDVVELAPITGLHGPDFAAAQLVYNIMDALCRSPGSRQFWRLPERSSAADES
ncbi:MAG: agmatinase [Desulfopila sp.]